MITNVNKLLTNDTVNFQLSMKNPFQKALESLKF